jgi:hypothetical protein
MLADAFLYEATFTNSVGLGSSAGESWALAFSKETLKVIGSNPECESLK